MESLKNLILFSPGLFMIHEMEEIIQIPSFSRHKHQLFKSFKHDTIGKITPQQFNIIVMEELLLLWFL
ncbi:hypothetical protein KII95_02070 [Leuconostoc gelidum subsp. aenigmaticum]|nr:hypothetical protein [Leuconostoc gelidum subsp. aenigmaticum]